MHVIRATSKQLRLCLFDRPVGSTSEEVFYSVDVVNTLTLDERSVLSQ